MMKCTCMQHKIPHVKYFGHFMEKCILHITTFRVVLIPHVKEDLEPDATITLQKCPYEQWFKNCQNLSCDQQYKSVFQSL